MVEDRRGECRTLCRVGAGSQFIEEHERIFVRLVQKIHDICHVRGKCRQGLFDALLIADVRVDLPENGDPAPVGGRDVQAGEPHDREKTCRL